MLRSTDRPAKTIAVDLGRKATKQTNKQFLVSKHGAKNVEYCIVFETVLFAL